MTSITLKNVAKRFGQVSVLQDIDLDIAEGEFCVFLGPSGCGKSTLLRMIAGIEATSAGELRIAGELMNDVEPADRRVAMVFQNYALYPHMSVYENMAFGLRQAKTPKPEIDARVRAAAQTLQIEPLLDRRPKELSGGQRQRVAIGRAIVRHPAVFLFDEPLSNLDAALRVHMRTEIANLHRDFPEASMVYVTHDQTEAMALADKIVLLRAGPEVRTRGSIAQVGAPLELYHRPANLFVAGFLGSPSMNFLPAELVGADADGANVRLASGETLRVAVDAGGLATGTALTLGLRPEHMRLAEGSDSQAIRRRVRAVENFGEYSYLFLSESSDEPLIAKISGDMLDIPDAPIALHVDPAECHLFDTKGDALPHTTAAAPQAARMD
ncbi:ABC transporter ATP-binding protein [Tropicimonas sp. IMCC34043]|uniref:ABC transporter ATP-binding protein n=1 Tax=Tropicimonas sp. IMCC34043 TaxID=2248760 RepID=UPI000E22E155|nr:sn-glycerol-3-phosphate ABC transporter ATP-binding protein UgpC [Tropicimonas sp. IMCC34043]